MKVGKVMRMLPKFKAWKIAGITAALGLVLAGCGNGDTESASAGNNDSDAKEIIVGTGNAYQPFVYLDENGKLTGYEKAVLDAVDEKLPQYKFKYESFAFKNILPARVSHVVNEEIKEKYLYGKVGYTDYTSYIVVDANSGSNFNTLDDLAGKKVYTSTGSNHAYILEQYNKEHDNKIDIVYGSGANEVLVKDLQTGTIDATLLTKFDVNKLNEQFKANLETSGEPAYVSKTYYLYGKDDTKLQEDIDGALQELIDEGKLSEISNEVLGGDFTK
jgi:L-cystine transport system substrate-binding protein